MLILLILCSAVSWFVCGLLLRYGTASGRRYGQSVPQRFHAGHVPRLGGVAMIVACTVGWAWVVSAERLIGTNYQIKLPGGIALAWWAVALIAVAGGVAEDVSHRLTATWRLLITVLSGVAATWLLGLSIPSLGIAALQPAWAATPWPGLALAIFAVAGLPHAFNLIDGYNGLAGTVALVCCLALAYVSLLVGDRQLAALVLVPAGATVGFLFWNYPRGLIFAGDGGAYLWGVIIAVASVQLVQRYSTVSPWFPVLLLIYPVWETLFSIYRKVARGQSPGVADALHFHQLIYRRIVRGVFDIDDEARRMLMRNNRTSPYLWGFTILTVAPAVLFWNNTRVLMAFTALFVICYVWAYVSIVRFKVPTWLRR
ncbi:glycosyltransferase [Ramlibacter solisilvae]|uniref:Glycosyl transferase n=1 Tax=Ramlibacter tataouinensis TaxID=94132 RepID=A0A127JV19_9BURK|nr:glycosyltransferase [Ramlibacter tataouinensis]AMO23857.1 glycosyl transferase [Ramlibacter tataouinensis]